MINDSRESWPMMLARHERERRDLVRRALVRCHWAAGTAARLLDTTPAVIRRVLERYPAMQREYAVKNPGRGHHK